MKEDMKERAFQVVSRVLKVEKNRINEATTQNSIETWDSLNHLLLITQIEREFHIQIPIEKAMSLFSMKQILECIEEEKGV
ncbi:MAG: acyl carrier protein [Nanoarchaeota archaeon]